MQAGQDITIGGRLSRPQYQYTLTDTNLDELNHWAPISRAEMRKLQELQDVASDQQIAAPHVAITVDRDAASRLGLTASLIDQTLYDAFGQRAGHDDLHLDQPVQGILEVEPQFREDAAALSKIYVPSPTGAQVPLSSRSRIIPRRSSRCRSAIRASSRRSPCRSTWRRAPRSARRSTPSRRSPVELNAPPTLNGSFQGTAQAFQASLSSMPLLVAAAILVVYIVLGILYESYIHPITILSALPSAGVGALLMLMLLRLRSVA